MTMYKLEFMFSMRYCKQDIIHKMTSIELRFSDDVGYLVKYAAQQLDVYQDKNNGYKMDKTTDYPVKGLDGLIIGEGHLWVLYDGDSYDDKKYELRVTIEPLIEKSGYHYHS